MKCVMIVAGGTGGHIFPALAVAGQLQRQGYRVVWLGARYGLESKLVPEHYPIELINMKGLRRRGLLAKLIVPGQALFALVKAYFVIKRVKPDLVLTMGGYVTVPGGVAAWLRRLPLIIHEQNARAGLSNRLLAKIACLRLQAFAHTFVSSKPVITVGNPIRDSLLKLPKPEVRYVNNHGGALRVLIVGGSQGARAINQCMLATWGVYPALDQISVWHQTGELDYEPVRDAYQKVFKEAKVQAFIADVAQAYVWADVVICRAGAMTVSEIAAVGVASVMIPYPTAVDKHQYYNAQYLSEGGAALLIEQKQLSTQKMLCL